MAAVLLLEASFNKTEMSGKNYGKREAKDK